MKSTTFALVAGVFTQTVFSAALDRRSEGVTLNLPQQHSQIRLLHQHPKTTLLTTKRQSTESSSVQGGAVLSPSSNKKINHVSATFIVPSAKVPTIGPTANNPVGVYASSFWVGIDGVALPTNNNASCNPSGASLRLGIDIFYDGTFGGEQTPFAWAQYLPRSATGFSNMTIAPGDLVRLTASSTNGSVGGTVTIENFGPQSSNTKKMKALQVASHTFSSPSEQDGKELPPLCQTQASIIVEDFPLAGMPEFPIALANFTTVEYGNIKISGSNGQAMNLLSNSKKQKAKGQAQVLNIVQPPQGGRLTDCSIRKQSGKGTYGSTDNSGVVVCERVVVPS
ncbi:Concanavalin A-like lectin/glucanase domain containing protein [Rhypophila sp. PSN 637]